MELWLLAVGLVGVVWRSAFVVLRLLSWWVGLATLVTSLLPGSSLCIYNEKSLYNEIVAHIVPYRSMPYAT